jgi:hypothetical protein
MRVRRGLRRDAPVRLSPKRHIVILLHHICGHFAASSRVGLNRTADLGGRAVHLARARAKYEKNQGRQKYSGAT